MKHLFVVASLLFVQASAFAQDRVASANPEPVSKNTCWKKNASDTSLTPQRLIRPATYVEDTTKTFERAARAQRAI